MIRRFAPLLLTWIAAALLAVSSVLSAAAMAPDRDREALTLTLQIFGGTEVDLCGDIAPHHDHRCPFCHQLPFVETPKIPEGSTRLALDHTQKRARDLVRGWQIAHSSAEARAPPRAL